MHIAISKKNAKIARLLILSGADQSARDKEGRRPKDFAWRHPGTYLHDAECEVENTLVLTSVWSCCNSFEESHPGCERDLSLVNLLTDDGDDGDENANESLEQLDPGPGEIFSSSSAREAEEGQYQNLDCIVRPELLTLGDELGDGNFGKVYKATWRRGDELVPVAIKTMKQDANPDFDHEVGIVI